MSARIANPLPGSSLWGDEPEPAESWIGIDPASGPDQMAGLYVITGTLARNAEVRTKPIGAQGDPAAVLCLDLQHVGPIAHSVHAEQVFPEADRKHAEALAAQLRKGTTVTVTCTMAQARIALPAVASVQINAPSKP